MTVLATGCLHRSQAGYIPPPPALNSPAGSPVVSQIPGERGRAVTVIADSPADAAFVRSHPAIYSEEGLASWYGPPYDRRRGANGEIYDQNALTAAHRTLPMNSLIQVTNVATGQSAIMRITDRGPFVPGRTLDLSLASAKAVGVWRPGVARVRIDVYATPAPIAAGGRWCVQIGAFRGSHEAEKLRDELLKKYGTANVIEFPGPTGYWVRIRPYKDDRGEANRIAEDLRPREGEAYLVRLD